MEIKIQLAKDLEKVRRRGALLFIPGEAAGAIPNGSRIVKANSQAGDSYPDGTPGTVVASHNVSDEPGMPHPFAYYVLFDPAPKVPTVISGARIREFAEHG